MQADMPLEEKDQDALTTGRSPWGQTSNRPLPAPLDKTLQVDIAVIGSGVTGALVAEHLTARGLSVCILEKEEPGLGSTAASTALLQWELDTQLSELSLHYGFETAAAIYRRSAVAVSGLMRLIERLDIACGLRARPTLYLTNSPAGARELQHELGLRKRAGLPGEYLSHPYLMTEFEIERDGGIFSHGSAEVDPLALGWGLLDVAMKRGARLVRAEAVRLHSESRHVTIETSGPHVVEAGHVVLATGYAMPGMEMPKLHRASSSWAMATVPQPPSSLWREQALIWEDSHPYLYARTTADNRIVIGGEDEDFDDPRRRDAKLAEKVATLREKLKLLWPQADTRVGYQWCGTFGETADGLPLIGPVPGMPRILAAYGYGGNGITFSFMAALMIGAMATGCRRDWFDDFALDRAGPGFKTFPGASEYLAAVPAH